MFYKMFTTVEMIALEYSVNIHAIQNINETAKIPSLFRIYNCDQMSYSSILHVYVWQWANNGRLFEGQPRGMEARNQSAHLATGAIRWIA